MCGMGQVCIRCVRKEERSSIQLDLASDKGTEFAQGGFRPAKSQKRKAVEKLLRP